MRTKENKCCLLNWKVATVPNLNSEQKFGNKQSCFHAFSQNGGQVLMTYLKVEGGITTRHL